jgi:methyl-accepting chemotaxis protein PixJ
MKTIDRDDTKQQADSVSPSGVTTPPDGSIVRQQPNLVTATSVLPDLAPDDDSFVWSVEDGINFTEMRPSTVVATDSRQYRTIHQQILFTLLPFVMLPLIGMGALFSLNHVLKPASPTSGTSTTVRNNNSQQLWLEYLILLLVLGGNLGFAMLISSRLSKSFKQISGKLSEAANGDLSAQIVAGENAEFQEVANSFNQLVTKFNRTLQQQRLTAQADRLFGKIALTAQEFLDPPQVYTVGAIGIRSILNIDRVVIYRCNPDGSGTAMAESLARDCSPSLATATTGCYFVESATELARYHQGRSLTIDDVERDRLSPNRQALAQKLAVKAIAFVPIVTGKHTSTSNTNDLVWLLSLQQCSGSRKWENWEIDFCQQTAQRIALAIEQIATTTEREAQLQRTNLLAQTLQVRDLDELGAILERALESVRQEFKLDRVLTIGLDDRQEPLPIASAIAPNCQPIPSAELINYLQYEVQLSSDGSTQICGIHDIDRAGGLTAEEIALLERIQVRARAIVPIVVEGQLLGWVVGQMAHSARKWELLELDKFAAVADQVGLALDRHQVLLARQANIYRQNLLAEITMQLRQSVDRTEIIEIALANIRRTFGLDRAVVLSLNDNWEGTIVAESVAEGTRSILGEVIEDTCLKQTQGAGYDRGRTTAIADIYQANLNNCHIEMLERLQVRANLVVPIFVGSKLFGLTIGHMCHAPRQWQAAEIELLERIGPQLGLALSQAETIARREDDARKSQILSNFTLQLRQSLKREDILATAVELVRQALDLDRAVVFELDTNFNGTIVAESVAAENLSLLHMQIEDTCLKTAGYEQGKITAIPDIERAGLSDCHLQMLKNLQVRANLVVPITIDSQIFGLLIAHECQQPRLWQKEEINLFTQLSTQLALALNQTVLIEQREAAAQRSQLLSDITLKLRESIDETQILNLALPEIRDIFGLDRASILVVDNLGEGEGKIIAEAISSPAYSILGHTLAADYMFEILGRGYKQGSWIEVADLQDSNFSTELNDSLRQMQIQSIITTPIYVSDKFFGLFSGTMCQQQRNWERTEIDLLLQLAIQIGAALTQAQLVRQLEAASIEQSRYAASQEAARQMLQKNAWELLMQVDRISQGDLTIRAHVTEDEIGTIADSYNSTVESLRGLVRKVQNVSREVVSTTTTNEISVAELSIEALQQAEDVTQSLQRLQDMSGSIQLVVNNALIAESAVMESAQLVRDGDAAMNRTVEGILTIRNTVAETGKKVKRLGESSQKISKVVNLISSFAAQTNLLALNASIEAARAGEEGRGFAVVAEEVRSLARQSAAATGEIEKLVASIQAETSEVAIAMEAGIEQVAIGTRLVDETRESLDRVSATSTKIGALVESIAQAALLQAENSDRVTQSIDRVANIATKNSTRADDVQASFQELLSLARELQTNVERFKIE